jgi:hypothetical protein
MELSGQFHALATLPSGKTTVTRWIGGWARLRIILDSSKETNYLPVLEIEPRSSSP